jgi:hypothetical protein
VTLPHGPLGSLLGVVGQLGSAAHIKEMAADRSGAR